MSSPPNNWTSLLKFPSTKNLRPSFAVPLQGWPGMCLLFIELCISMSPRPLVGHMKKWPRHSPMRGWKGLRLFQVNELIFGWRCKIFVPMRIGHLVLFLFVVSINLSHLEWWRGDATTVFGLSWGHAWGFGDCDCTKVFECVVIHRVMPNWEPLCAKL